MQRRNRVGPLTFLVTSTFPEVEEVFRSDTSVEVAIQQKSLGAVFLQKRLLIFMNQLLDCIYLCCIVPPNNIQDQSKAWTISQHVFSLFFIIFFIGYQNTYGTMW